MGVHASLFHLVGDAQQFRDLQQEESDGSESARPKDDHQNHDNLCCDGSTANGACLARTVIVCHAAKSAPAMIVIESLAPVEQSSSQQTPNAAEAVHRAGIHRIVDVQLLQKHRSCLVHKGRNKASSNGASRFHVAAACCDSHQPSKDTVAQATHIIFVRDDVTQNENTDATSRRSQRCVHGNLCRKRTIIPRLHGQGGTWVEAVPAKPQSKGAQHHQWQVVALKLLRVHKAALPGSQNCGASETSHSATKVDNAAASLYYDLSPTGMLTGDVVEGFENKHKTSNVELVLINGCGIIQFGFLDPTFLPPFTF